MGPDQPAVSIGGLGEPLLRRVLIIRALPGLGDMLCAVPAWRALRTALPAAHITLLGLPWAADFVGRFPRYLDTWLEFPGYPGIPERPLDPQQIVTFLAQAQAAQFDLVLQMHGNGSFLNEFALLLGARTAAGFCRADLFCPDTERFLPYPATGSEIWRHLRLMEFLGVPLQGTHLEFPVTEEDRRALEALPVACNLPPGAYVCLHPGAKAVGRRWATAQFAAVADGLAARGLRIVLTGGPDEAQLTAAVARAMRAPALDLAGQTTLGSLAALLQSARLLLCNDTGVSHLAAALRVPSVVIFTGSDPDRWAPLDRRRHRALVANFLPDPGAPVALTPHPWLNAEIPPLTVERVLAEADDLLGAEYHYAA